MDNQPKFIMNLSDTTSKFQCHCGATITVKHDSGIMANNNAPKFCSNCGIRFNWTDYESIKQKLNDIIDNMEIYTVGRPNEEQVNVSVFQMQQFINELKNIKESI